MVLNEPKGNVKYSQQGIGALRGDKGVTSGQCHCLQGQPWARMDLIWNCLVNPQGSCVEMVRGAALQCGRSCVEKRCLSQLQVTRAGVTFWLFHMDPLGENGSMERSVNLCSRPIATVQKSLTSAGHSHTALIQVFAHCWRELFDFPRPPNPH